VPVPKEHAMNGNWSRSSGNYCIISWKFFSLTDAVINNSISDALAEAERAGIKGKEVTPFILSAISKITAGKSLQTST
jgi:pseudouridine-5'-phosphate glycosidase